MLLLLFKTVLPWRCPRHRRIIERISESHIFLFIGSDIQLTNEITGCIILGGLVVLPNHIFQEATSVLDRLNHEAVVADTSLMLVELDGREVITVGACETESALAVEDEVLVVL